MYYFNSATKTTSWQRPAVLGPESESESDGGEGSDYESGEDEVQAGRNGWVRVRNSDGNVYFHNEVTAKTQWSQPPEF